VGGWLPPDEVDEARVVGGWIAANGPPALELRPQDADGRRVRRLWAAQGVGAAPGGP
jgi:DNA polymerase-3 subunit epsilon